MKTAEWVRCPPGSDGVELLAAAFERHMYGRHIHDTYAIGLTLRGVQRLWCRGATQDGTPGHVIVINPGEVHDGQSGAPGGYAYRMFSIRTDVFEDLLEGQGCFMGASFLRAWTMPWVGPPVIGDSSVSISSETKPRV